MKKSSKLKQWFQKAMRDREMRQRLLSDYYYYRTVLLGLLVVFGMLALVQLLFFFGDGIYHSPGWGSVGGLMGTLLGAVNAGMMYARNQMLIAMFEAFEEETGNPLAVGTLGDTAS